MVRSKQDNRRHSNGFAGRLSVLSLGLVLSSCASQVPQSIRQAPAQQLSVAAAQASATPIVGAPVRWGGELVAVTNLAQGTELEILGRGLRRGGKPNPDSAAEGRFIVTWEAFLDPADYRPGQPITISGTLTGTRLGRVGEFTYRYPVVAGKALYRWQAIEPAAVRTPYYGWPYYDPWWFYRPYRRPGYWW